MTPTLPPILATMLMAHNAHDSGAFTTCFADDAVVRDEGQKHVGKAAIRTWFETVSRKYDPVFHVTAFALVDGEPVLTGKVSGNFPGSPIELRYRTGVEDGKIVALTITP
jgi:hypothetical protein